MSKELVGSLRAAVGAGNVFTEEHDTAAYSNDWRKRYYGKPLAVVRPGSTAEVSAVVGLCAKERVAIVPQGGNTSLVGGAVPDASGRQVVLSLARMNKVRAVDTLNNTLTVEAGVVLANVQKAAEEANRLFPLSLAAEGSAMIGGNLSTNAGGIAVLRYGNARELVLGLEVVLADGSIWDGLRGLRKDNTGYDLKHLFIGAEGTLGVITAAVLKLFPLPVARMAALVAVDNPDRALSLLELAQSRLGERLTGFELFSDFCIGLVLKHYPACTWPLPERHPHYVLIEVSELRSEAVARESLEELLGEAYEAGLVRDAAVAQSIAQSRDFWALRENISEAQAHEGKNIKHDVSVPISRIGEFIRNSDAALTKAFPGARLVTFGHLGDGNLHYNLSPPEGEDPERFMGQLERVNLIVHDEAVRLGGSISAEHGLGQLKRGEIRRYKTELELDMMRRVKAALDPHGLMNPGKLL